MLKIAIIVGSTRPGRKGEAVDRTQIQLAAYRECPDVFGRFPRTQVALPVEPADCKRRIPTGSGD
jgi:hypothetical protein